jgi:sporulation protein YlmC with PRC-barrel domain
MKNGFLYTLGAASLAFLVMSGQSAFADPVTGSAMQHQPGDEPMAHPLGLKKQIFYSYKDDGNYLMRASDLIGAIVDSVEGKEIGKVTDFVIENYSPFLEKGSTSQKAPEFIAVITVGGIISGGKKVVGVPFQDLEILPKLGLESLVYPAGKEKLKSLPEFTYPQLR